MAAFAQGGHSDEHCLSLAEQQGTGIVLYKLYRLRQRYVYRRRSNLDDGRRIFAQHHLSEWYRLLAM